MDSAREDQPRVSLGTVRDWRRLKANYSQNALTHLEEVVASSNLGNEKDALIAYMNQFVDQTFKMAQPNLRVNGQNYETLDQSEHNIEPFDESLDRRIWSLADTRLQWHKKIAETRRKVPIDIENSLTTVFKEDRATAAEELAIEEEEYLAEQEVADEPLPNYPEVEEGFQKILALGEQLDQGIKTQDERITRSRDVAREIKELKS